MQQYKILSIETHLFFARIMKEHALFLEAGFPCKEEACIQKADWFRCQFEELLRDAVRLGDGRISNRVVRSEELVTEFTLPAERKTEQLSGISIDSEITAMERKLRPGCQTRESREIFQRVTQLNRRALQLLNGLISFKEGILKEISRGELFNTNYPLLIKHITREAKWYRAIVEELLKNGRISRKSLQETELFWNQIMMEHALFIRGLLDPSEEQLIAQAEGFAADYKKLLETARLRDCKAMEGMRGRSLKETMEYRKFKTAGAEGILDHSIASIILPLLADHVLREANHYIRLLESGSGE